MSRRHGFSVTTILIVLAILGILAALLLPALARARGEAKKKSCQNNLKQIGLAFAQYVMAFGDNRNYPDGVGAAKLAKLYNVTSNIRLIEARTLICPETEDTNDPANIQGAADASYASLAKDKVAEDEVADWKTATASDDDEGTVNHRDGMNVLFGDGHVEWAMGRADLPEGLTN